MSGLEPEILEIKLTIGSLPDKEAEYRLERVLLEAITAAKAQFQLFELEIPRATGDLRSDFKVRTRSYGKTKSIEVEIDNPYAEYVLEFGRKAGKRPPWESVRTWALAKGVPVRKARAWWFSKGGRAKRYRSPQNQDLTGWWSRKKEQMKVMMHHQLQNKLRAAGFPQDQFRIEVQR